MTGREIIFNIYMRDSLRPVLLNKHSTFIHFSTAMTLLYDFDIIETSKRLTRGSPESLGIVECASQAPKSTARDRVQGLSYNSISRARRSFPRSSNHSAVQRGTRIVQKVYRLRPLHAISAREALESLSVVRIT